MAEGDILKVSVERTPYGDIDVHLPPAEHNSLGLHLTGRCTLEWATGARPFIGRPLRGDVTLTPSGRSGRLAVRGGACEVLKIIVPDPVLSAWADDQEQRPRATALIDRFTQRDPLIQQIGLTLLAEVERPGTADHLYRDALSLALVAHLVRRHSESNVVNAPERRATKLTDGRAKRAIEFMEADLVRAIGLVDIAREVGLSTSYFASQFTSTFGRSPGRYLTLLRLERARLLLQGSKVTISDVAYRVGFATPSHFSQAFKAEFGLTPSAYRSN